MSEYLDFPRDNERYKYFNRESREHGAKLELRTFKWLVERYTKPGDMILDPMAGIGTSLYACAMGRKVINIEINPEFVAIQRLNAETLSETTGVEIKEDRDFQILEMDNRRALPLSPGVQAVIFSPPYGLVMKKTKAKDENKLYEEKGFYMSYSEDAGNIGNISNYPLYLTAMREVYRLCLQSLVPGGIMVSVTKDYNQNFQRIYVSKDNARVAIEVGFVMEDWHLRNSPGTVMQHIGKKRREESGKGTPENDILVEDVMVFKRPND
jgi:modification methylase